MATIRIPSALRTLTGGNADVSVSAATVRDALAELERKHPGIAAKVLDGTGSVKPYIRIYVRSEDIGAQSGLDTNVDDRDEKSLDALTELFAELGRHRDLADLYLRRAEAASSGETAAPYRLALARLYRKELSDTGQAVDQLESIVQDVPWHKEAIQELEDLVGDEEHKARVVEILRPLYERADDWRKPFPGWPGTRYEAKALAAGRRPTYLEFSRA